MKTTLLVLTVAGLSGCAVYPVPAYPTYPAHGGGPPMVVEQPVYIEGGYQRRAYDYPRGYSRPAPVVVPVPRALPHRPPPHRLHHDRSHGDRDLDGDGARDRSDRWPNDPRRR